MAVSGILVCAQQFRQLDGPNGERFPIGPIFPARRASWKIYRLSSSFCWSRASLSPSLHVAGIGAGIELILLGVSSADQGGGKRRGAKTKLLFLIKVKVPN